MRIFIAGPYGDHNPKRLIKHNVKVADMVARNLVALGHQVFVPHTMSWGWEDDDRISLKALLDLDNSFLALWAEGLYRIPGPSSGADSEATKALSLGLPVFEDGYFGFRACPECKTTH